MIGREHRMEIQKYYQRTDGQTCGRTDGRTDGMAWVGARDACASKKFNCSLRLLRCG